MSSPSSFTTLSQATSTTWMPSSHDEPSIHKSDKPVIIGLTIGVVVLFLLFILPCCCFQFLAHWQQKRMNREARERARKAAIAPGRPAAEV
ncbi:hypothetical protein BKA59DRAFT_464865 [Fusarium tricinctum]|uniref:Uncharacterized protein n=2 Tax=Fusarium tricinctum species complex TaxID=679429 RepID=A0A8K0S872_9HYPO|nr:hypothetical protein BKA59DRAFT_464865 [Fusarium tricinctum]